MYWLAAILGLAFALCFWVGFQRMIRLQHLTQQRIVNGFIGAMVILSLMAVGQWLQLISQDISVKFTMLMYSAVSGFFFGFGVKMIALRKQLKASEYVHRSFWTEAAPTIIALLIITFGIYRTGLLTFGPYTGVGITSGLSLLGFGFLGLTVKIVPEFRFKGILILDQYVNWEKVVAYSWEREEVLRIDYYTESGELTDFSTYIPPDDQLIVERLLGKKLEEHKDERKKMMSQSDEIS